MSARSDPAGGSRSIAGVSTSVTGFVDFFTKGPTDQPRPISSFEDFTRHYGGLDSRSEASYGIMQYFRNGGREAVVLRVFAALPDPDSNPDAEPEPDAGEGTAAGVATRTMFEGADDARTSPRLIVDALNPGAWGNQVQVGIEHVGDTRFNLVLRRVQFADGRNRVTETELHLNLSMDVNDRRHVAPTVNAFSQLIQVRNADDASVARPGATTTAQTPNLQAAAVLDDLGATAAGQFLALESGSDGVVPALDQIAAALPTFDVLPLVRVNILCLPIMSRSGDGYDRLVAAANTFCTARRAFLIIDPYLEADTMEQILAFNMTLGEPNNAIYFPRLVLEDPLSDNNPRIVAASGTIAGIYARTDIEQGIWKAPAGVDARIRGADIAGTPLTDADNSQLNPLGLNALRRLAAFGNVVWGGRTGDGANDRASEWKYVPVRRTALYIEESLVRGLQWVVFEPNDEPLWAQIRQSVGGFMQTLFRKGAFQGSTPGEAYLVRCDSTTTTQADIDDGIVNILVGFAPLKPAEFVVIHLQQVTAVPPT